MKKKTRLAFLIGGIAVIFIAIYYAALYCSWWQMATQGSINTALNWFLIKSFSMMIGNWGMAIHMLILIVTVFAIGVKRAWVVAAIACISAVGIAVLAVQIGATHFSTSIINSEQVFSWIFLEAENVFFYLLSPTAYFMAAEQIKRNRGQAPRLSRGMLAGIGTATLVYAVWIAIILVMMFLSSRVFMQDAQKGILPRDSLMQAIISSVTGRMRGISSAQGAQILLLVPFTLYFTAKFGRICATISWVVWTAVGYGVAVAAGVITAALGYDMPRSGNYIMEVPPAAISLFIAFAISIVISFAISWLQKNGKIFCNNARAETLE